MYSKENNIVSVTEKIVSSLEKKLYLLTKDQKYADAEIIADQIYEIEKKVFVLALDNFVKYCGELSYVWEGCNDRIQDESIISSYPFDGSFEEVYFKILGWSDELKNKLETESIKVVCDE